MKQKEEFVISGFHCVRIVPVRAGMSSDGKYDVTLTDGRRCMLRISPDNQFERKKAEYGMLETAWRYGIPVSCPYEFGRTVDGKIYQLTQWLEGRSLEEELAESGETEKYAWGERAGRLLRKIHAIPMNNPAEAWNERFRRKIEIRMAEAEAEMDPPEYMKRLCQYLLEKIAILEECGQCFNHGDFYPGNLMHLTDGSLAVIDFNAYNSGYGDPVFETTSILLDRHTDNQFKAGFRAGYYGKETDKRTEQLLEYYQAYILLAELCETDDENERNDILGRMHELMDKTMMKH